MNENIIKAFNLLANDILSLFKSVLASDVGINAKVGENTLKDSRLANTAVINSDIPFYHLILNAYIDDIENGRRVRQQPLVKIEALRDWARRKGISSDNHTLRIIQAAIWRDGIKGRPVMKTFWKMMDKEWKDSYAEVLFEAIVKELEEYFND
jgi:hypothetical protein